ncbi:hypothetical protein PMZ80_000106 [Knufia obscura]|uniref:CBM21 domain-containing protein n=1 Tax=Knufia obscura TaxID=1635080 RepID=A0ABR0RZX1_9EURO|nr:hypothetical protein PMZ80_000106 [Knufia obscura]
MPYTPPSQLSPAGSKQSTPTPSRSHSYIQYNAHPEFSFPTTDMRPSLPRSAGSSSYLTKHRRSPSAPTGNELPEVMSDVQRGVTFDPHGSLRQSPPPRTNGIIPQGMTISPPESTHNSDDEETRGRSRELEKENLAELQAAIRGLREERHSGSPTRTRAPPQENGHKAASEGCSPAEDSRLPLSSSQRKISHSRSSTDSNIIFEVTPAQSQPQLETGLLSPQGADSDTDGSDSIGARRPPMVRKKSGELVKPALRPHSRRRPSSMPGTPTYGKAVHFDSQLEHIRHFLQVDRPLAVSAGSSPVENYESESEFPFGSDPSGIRSRGPSYEWEIRLANFPPQSDERKALPIHVERVFLSADKKHLIGTVAVQNLAFQKQVTARFTLDYWKTTSEVGAEYSNDLRKTSSADNLDHFTFSISLADQANLENKTLFFCVRYNVNGQEYWDSNNSINYQVDFTKKAKVKTSSQQPSGLGTRPLNALPRSRPSPPTSSGRPKSMPVSFDDFGSGFDSNFGVVFAQSPTSLIGEPKIKLRSPRSKQDLVPDAPRRNKSAAPMFATRYDFNSSLSAAKNSAYAVLGEQSGLSAIDTKQSFRDVPVVPAKSASQKPEKLENGVHNVPAVSSAPAVSAPSVTSKPVALFSEKPSLSSQSYQELVDKYCFVVWECEIYSAYEEDHERVD